MDTPTETTLTSLLDLHADDDGKLVWYTGLKLRWSELCHIEPGLRVLRRRVKMVREAAGPEFCANLLWYGMGQRRRGIKKDVCHLVGWTARKDDPVIRSPEAYDLVYDKLYAMLPDCCPGCNCYSWLDDIERTYRVWETSAYLDQSIDARRREWNAMREYVTPFIFHYRGRKCEECVAVTDLTIDHIVPLAHYGTNEPSNLRVLCRSCNSRKGARYDG